MDPVTYSEIRKIDGRPVAASPVAGSLADILANAGLKPYTNYVVFIPTVTDTYEVACNLSGAGQAFVHLWQVGSTQKQNLKITVDGNVIFPDPGAEYLTYGYNFGFSMRLAFNTSLKVEVLSTSANYGKCVVSYNVA